MYVKRLPPPTEELLNRIAVLESLVADLIEAQAQKCSCSHD